MDLELTGKTAIVTGSTRGLGLAIARALLTEVASECTRRLECVQIDREGNHVQASTIFSWRDREFVAAYAASAAPRFSRRSPVERAILAYVEPKLFGLEQELLVRNTFDITFLPFDWSLNDLTGRGGR